VSRKVTAQPILFNKNFRPGPRAAWPVQGCSLLIIDLDDNDDVNSMSAGCVLQRVVVRRRSLEGAVLSLRPHHTLQCLPAAVVVESRTADMLIRSRLGLIRY